MKMICLMAVVFHHVPYVVTQVVIRAIMQTILAVFVGINGVNTETAALY